MSRLAIIAGRGALPEILARSHPDALVVSFDGVGTDFLPENHLTARFEKLGTFFKKLREEGVETLCFAGAVKRPELKLWRMDAWTIRAFPKIKRAIAESDGNTLAIIRQLVEEEGFELVGAHQLSPELLAGMGALGKLKGDGDIEVALMAHRAMSQEDRGQALIVRDGRVIAEENREGTAAMIASIAVKSPPSGYLYKASKHEQDLDMDMATIGPETIDQIAAAGLEGVYIGADRTLVLHRDEVIARANAAALFVVGMR